MHTVLLDATINVICISIIAQYFWSTNVHFVTGQKTAQFKLLLALVALTSLLFTAGLWQGSRSPAPAYAALAVLLVSDALFWWAVISSRAAGLHFIFDADKPESVLRKGVYAYIRHPFYTSYMLFWAGWAIAVWHPLAAVPVMAFAVIYTAAARNEERVFLASNLRDDYTRYMETAGRFFPKLR
jgi:protein-S-isoprenylcysteine O-methyltransferase Ste14